MSEFTEKIKGIEGVYTAEGCSDAQIWEAETTLGISLPIEFKEYAKEFGAFGFGGIQWTGLNVSKHLNTVDLTLAEREINPQFSNDLFVLENIGNENLIIASDAKGNVYEISGCAKKLVSDSLMEYLDLCIKDEFHCKGD